MPQSPEEMKQIETTINTALPFCSSESKSLSNKIIWIVGGAVAVAVLAYLGFPSSITPE